MKLSSVELRLFGRICYGYRRDKQGLVEIVPEEAEVVKTIFGLYRAGNSLEFIQSYLFSYGIPSPSGNAHWSRDVLNKLLNNGKYTKGIIQFEEYCEVYFLKGENCRNHNQTKAVKQMPRATKEELEWAYALTREKFLVRVNKLSPIRAADWNRYLDVIFESIRSTSRR